MALFPDDWGKVLLPQVPIFESIIRITIVYLVIFLLLRVILKRESSGMGISDLLVLVLLADAVQNGMAGNATSVGDVLILGATLIFLDWFLSLLGYHQSWFYRLIRPKPLQVIREGKILTSNARKELMTREDIEEQLHLQGIESLSEVKEAFIESNGDMSVIKQDQKDDNQKKSKPPMV